MQQQPQQQQKQEKSKGRLTSLDISALVKELNEKLTGMRVANVYDLSQKVYLLKLNKSESKDFLIIDNGIRFHTTDMEITKNKMPTAFTMKFRKFLRSKRIEGIRQVGVERVVVITFGQGESQNHLILELYAQGNIVLTDKDFRILALIRSHEFSETVKTAVGELYPFEQAANLFLENFKSDEESILKALEGKEDKEQDQEGKQEKEVAEVKEEEEQNKGKQNQKQNQDKNQKNQNQNQNQNQNKKGKEGKGGQNQKKGGEKADKGKEKKLKEVVFKLVPSLHPAIIEHILKENGLNYNQKVGKENIQEIQKATQICIDFSKEFIVQNHKGYLYITDASFQKQKQEDEKFLALEQTQQDNKELKKQNFIQYFEVSPIKLNTFEGKQFVEYESFNQAIDVYFQSISSKKGVFTEEDKEQIIWKKYENIKQDQEGRVKKLRTEQEKQIRKAELIEKNNQLVDNLLTIVRTIKQGGTSWDQIVRQINESKKEGNPFANLIHSMSFEKDSITVLLEDPENDEHEEMVDVELELSLTAFQNAQNFYQLKKKNQFKEQKTLQASKLTLQQAEKTALRQLETLRVKKEVVSSRKVFWFEKFYWFFTSENYLVISGRDAQQNEMLVKKYMRPGDYYMHADFHGAATTIIKNYDKNEPIPPLSLDEAAIATVCRSKAWENKLLASAWWVYDNQVSKRAETGEFLPHGSFMIRGKKNFLYPNRMEMGAVILFKIEDQESIDRHAEDRRVRVQGQQSEQNLEVNREEIGGENKEKDEQNKDVTILHTNLQQNQRNTQIRNKQIQNKINQGEKEAKERQEEKNDKQKKNKKGKKNQAENLKETELNPNQFPRGKRNKVKKVMDKYDDEFDEQEMQLRQQLLGAKSVKGVELKNKKGDIVEKKVDLQNQNESDDESQDDKINNKNQKDSENEDSQENDSEEQNESDKDDQEINQQQNKPKGFFDQLKEEGVKKPYEKKVKEVEILNEKKKEEGQKKQQKQLKEEKDDENKSDKEGSIKDSGDEENDEEQDDEKEKQPEVEEKFEEDDKQIESELSDLKKLVTWIHQDDVYYHFMFMCAPYMTILNLNCKFKVKLTPGNMKKGKASRQIIQFFQSQKEILPEEKKMLGTIPEQEMINCIIGNVKVQAAGMLKIQQDQRQQKRENRKAKEAQEVNKKAKDQQK